MAAFSCGKEIEPDVLPEDNTPVEQPATEFTYSVSINASKGALVLLHNGSVCSWCMYGH